MRTKDICGYENYSVTEDGKVYSKKRGIYLKYHKTNSGYLQVQLFKNSVQKNYYVHRLVAEAFIPNSDGLPCVNHKNENKEDNRVENLEWCTQEYNIKYGGAQNKRVERSRKNGTLKRYTAGRRTPLIALDNAGIVVSDFDTILNAGKTVGIKKYILGYYLHKNGYYDAITYKIFAR